MCRNIKRLHNVEPPVKSDEVRDASLQFVRKIAGTTKPSKANEEAFARAVEEIAAASQRLLGAMVSHAPPQDREAAAEKRREKFRAREARA
jgi:hypothetical protein